MSKTVLQVPEQLEKMIDSIQDVLNAAEQQVKRGKLGGPVNYRAFEESIGKKLREVERRVHEVALEALDPNVPRVLINNVPHVRVLHEMETSFMADPGPVRVKRSLYRPIGQRNAPTVDVVALRAGAVQGVWLPGTAREMAFDIQQITSREAEARGARRGRLPYSHSSFELIAHAVGDTYNQLSEPIAEAIADRIDVSEEACTVTVSLDRVSVPMEEPAPEEQRKKDPKKKICRQFRMAYCGTVTLHDEQGRALRTLRYGTMPSGDPVRLVAQMASDVIAILAQQPELQLGLLCDGAAEMWNLLETEFSKPPFDLYAMKIFRLIDFWHAIEKLAPAAKLIAGDEKGGKQQLAQWQLLLRNSSSGRARILAELHESGLENEWVGKEQPVHNAITYFTNNTERMDYAAARSAGFPIGSGNVEATCKSLVELRMKRPGARWKNETGEHIIRMRALALSDHFDDAMDIVLHPPRVHVRPIAA